MTAAIRTCKTVLGYNARSQWLADAHAVLDAAVAAAYGWDAGISRDEALRSLLGLNAAGRMEGG